jgi:hypothetical protein
MEANQNVFRSIRQLECISILRCSRMTLEFSTGAGIQMSRSRIKQLPYCTILVRIVLGFLPRLVRNLHSSGPGASYHAVCACMLDCV